MQQDSGLTACVPREAGRPGDEIAQFHHGTKAPLGGRVLRQAQDRSDLGEVQAIEVAQGQDLAVDWVEPLQRRPHHLGALGTRQGRGGPGLGIDQVLGQRHGESVRPGDVTGDVVLRAESSADQLDEPVEHLAIDPGIEVGRFRARRLPPRPGPDECLLNHPFGVDPRGQLAADPPLDHRQQPRAQPLEGTGEDGLPGQVGQRRL